MLHDYYPIQSAPSRKRGIHFADDVTQPSNAADPEPPAAPPNPLLAHLTKQQPIADGNVRTLIQQATQQPSTDAKKVKYIDGVKYTACVHNVLYRVTQSKIKTMIVSLMDWGANGGYAGDDVRKLYYTMPA